jgi:hypothetical protein
VCMQRQAEHAEVGAHEGRGACVKTVVLAMAGGHADAGAHAYAGARTDVGARADARVCAGVCANAGGRVLTQAQAQTEGHSRETCVCHSACTRHNDDAGLPSGGCHRIPSPQVLWHHGKVLWSRLSALFRRPNLLFPLSQLFRCQVI